jgi:hypothetical protein
MGMSEYEARLQIRENKFPKFICVDRNTQAKCKCNKCIATNSYFDEIADRDKISTTIDITSIQILSSRVINYNICEITRTLTGVPIANKSYLNNEKNFMTVVRDNHRLVPMFNSKKQKNFEYFSSAYTFLYGLPTLDNFIKEADRILQLFKPSYSGGYERIIVRKDKKEIEVSSMFGGEYNIIRNYLKKIVLTIKEFLLFMKEGKPDKFEEVFIKLCFSNYMIWGGIRRLLIEKQKEKSNIDPIRTFDYSPPDLSSTGDFIFKVNKIMNNISRVNCRITKARHQPVPPGYKGKIP